MPPSTGYERMDSMTCHDFTLWYSSLSSSLTAESFASLAPDLPLVAVARKASAYTSPRPSRLFSWDKSDRSKKVDEYKSDN